MFATVVSRIRWNASFELKPMWGVMTTSSRFNRM